MKALFWNIGSSLTNRKLALIAEAINGESPDIFCIAEGGGSDVGGTSERETYKKIQNVFTAQKYVCYYSPAFCDDKALGLDYGFNECGLKIFVKNGYIPKRPFTGADQREDGRYIILRTEISTQPVTFIFLHGKAKSGGANVTPTQGSQMTRLYDMITIGKVIDESERVVMIGDFNLEPWDTLLNAKDTFNTSFFSKRNLVNHRAAKKERHYFNPIMEFVVNSSITNLGGTYYKKSIGWALFDTILYDTSEGDISFNVLTQLEKSILLNGAANIHHSFLNDNLDHLPIVAILKEKSNHLGAVVIKPE